MPNLEIVEILSVPADQIKRDGETPITGARYDIEVVFYCDCVVVYSGGQSYVNGDYRGRVPEAAGFEIEDITWDVPSCYPRTGVVVDPEDHIPAELNEYITKWVQSNLEYLERQCNDQYAPGDFSGNSDWDF